ncbi:MAG: hypothetical protein JRJ06_04615 [Deltaproteobacteria bacterium]|nr:hypothetical protein [Deltaproteobacteria bacterium]MBW1863891.1 hypothetical protein [Deltaproteobacteria bacterium]
MSQERIAELEKELKELKEKLLDREDALPAHSIRAHQMQEVMDIEDEIAEKEGELLRIKEQ